MLTALLSRLVILVFGTMLPAFSSYKAIRTKNMRGYVQWMMYWIVFALFTVVETFTDLLLAWLPFYYEVKMLLVFWLLSPATHGSSLLYRQFVHPWLLRNELEIERCIERAQQHGYAAVVQLGTRGMSYATQVLIQTAMAGGSGLASQMQRSFSVNDVTDLTAQRRPLPAPTVDECSAPCDTADDGLEDDMRPGTRRLRSDQESSDEVTWPTTRRRTRNMDAVDTSSLPRSSRRHRRQ